MNETEFNEDIMKPLELTFGVFKENRKERYNIYYSALSNFSKDILTKAVNKIILENKYFPKPAEIIKKSIEFLPTKSKQPEKTNPAQELLHNYLSSEKGQELLKRGLGRYIAWHIEEHHCAPSMADIEWFERDDARCKHRGKYLKEEGIFLCDNGEEIKIGEIDKSLNWLRCEFELEARLKSEYLKLN